jgi:hypothetical protein
MNSSTWIIFLPIFIVFIVELETRLTTKARIRRKRGQLAIMTNEIIRECVGRICTINMGYTGSGFNKVLVKEIHDNWMKVESKGKTEIINIEYIQNIKIVS